MTRRPEQLARYRVPTWLLITIAGLGAIAAATTGGDNAHAAGSDAPITYTIDSTGITLAPGDTFADSDHVNIRYLVEGVTIAENIHLEAKCATRDDAECAGRPHDLAAALLGTNRLPFTVLSYGSLPLCVTWVQISLYGEHFGEGGQAPICTGTTPTPSASPTPEPSPSTTATPEPSRAAAATPVPSSSTNDASPEPSPLQTAPVALVLGTDTPDELPATGHREIVLKIAALAGAFSIFAGVLGWLSDRRRRRGARGIQRKGRDRVEG